jgi:hypothetical protein
MNASSIDAAIASSPISPIIVVQAAQRENFRDRRRDWPEG